MNVQEYRNDLKELVLRGELLLLSLCDEFQVEAVVDDGVAKRKLTDYLKEHHKGGRASLPSFKGEYEKWYSEALEVIRQTLPSRYEDFRCLYRDDRRKGKDAVDHLTYTISDYMIGLTSTRGWEKEIVVSPRSALPKFQQQLAILQAAERRFESSLFDIRRLLQADLFDSEIDTARELLKNGYLRAAGAVAGVVLEKHLGEVCAAHRVMIKKKKPGISDYNETLKQAEVLDVPTWRFIQRLADLRNLCDHKRTREPKLEEIEDLIGGVEKVSKNIF